MNLHHTRPHNEISTEFHTRSGPFTLVPLPGLRSSLVCVVTAEEAERLAAMPLDALGREIERRSHSILGKITVDPGVGRWPLGIETPEVFARGRVALVGEAAHVIPPIGAQGLNLGLRDGAQIAELLVDAKRAGEDLGSDAISQEYHRCRSADILSRTRTVDALNRTLLSDFIGAQGMRGLGLFLLDKIGPLRRRVMREGVEPSIALPRMMRGEVL
jgi:2-octaprenyl-6-methoxyphenol hydroxylase